MHAVKVFRTRTIIYFISTNNSFNLQKKKIKKNHKFILDLEAQQTFYRDNVLPYDNA